jgi:3-oxoacyl-[acyl-carrier protein] reductase
MNLGIQGKVALVTGGSHGIGRSIAHALAAEGCCVAICARRDDVVRQVVSEITAKGGTALGIIADAMNAEDTDRVFREVIASWSTIHILVNNVGGGGRWGSPVVEETGDEVWKEVYEKNAMAAVRFTKHAIPLMKHQGWGRIVTIASLYGREGGGRPWFAMAKSAEIALMKTLSLNHELSGAGTTFNSVSPGRIMIPDTGWETEMRADPRAFEKMIRETHPQGKMGTPEQVAATVAFLCSEQAGFINGANIAIDGGEGKAF